MSIVTGTIQHRNATVRDLTFDGRTEGTLGVTANHPLYSETRHAWIPAGDLQLDEVVRTLNGHSTLTTRTQRPTHETVFNLEVYRSHAYHVSELGVLAHNTGLPCPKRDKLGRFTSESGGNTADAARGREAHINYRNALGDGYKFEQRLPSGKRVDAVDYKNRTVRELKPDNPRTISDGLRQLEGYRQELQQEWGGIWKGFLDTYSP